MAVEERRGDILTLPEIAKLPGGLNGGYAIRYLPKGHPQRRYASAAWQFEHRLVAEAILGRLLRKSEEVHHRNGRLNNTPFNLKVMKKVPHQRLHNPLLGEFRLCLNCGKPFYRPLSWINQGRGLYCSNKCAAVSPRRVESARENLQHGKPIDFKLNTNIYQLRQSGMTWRQISITTSVPYGGVRERYLYALGTRRRNGHRTKAAVSIQEG